MNVILSAVAVGAYVALVQYDTCICYGVIAAKVERNDICCCWAVVRKYECLTGVKFVALFAYSYA
jgi:hypothetical protein